MKAAAPPPEETFPVGRLIAKIAFGVVALLVFLSLISYDPEDTHLLAGGLGGYATIHNWIGLLGAHVSQACILWLGFAAYPGILLVMLCIAVRIFGRNTRPFRWIYIGGIAATVIGLSMCLGTYPDVLHAWAAAVNLSRTPGGALGQRLCAPWTVESPGGWLAYVVNRPGSLIISVAMLGTGAVTVWLFDWREQCRVWRRRMVFYFQQQRVLADEQRAAAEREEQQRRDKEEEARRQREWEAEKERIKAQAQTPAKASPPQDLPTSPNDNIKDGDRPKGRKPAAARRRSKYKLPSLSLLHETGPAGSLDPREIARKKEALQETLDSFGIDAVVGDSTSGPRVTLFEIKPAPGVKVERISSLQNNIAMNLKAESLRILTPIPGRDTVGIEVPNSVSKSVPLRGLFGEAAWKNSKAALPIALGKDISGKTVILDLARAPHLLIAGATGSGKSVCMNTLIMSLLFRFAPEDLKLIMVDPKVVEFSGYGSLPHLVTPVVTDVKKVPIALRWVLNQMEWRYQVLSKVGVRNIASYNSRKPAAEPIYDDAGDPIPLRLPYMIVIIDELADIMMTAKGDVETSLARIAQLARAVGIHAVIATQRPSVNIITGVIKANFPTRIAFQVSSVPDSRTILDTKGAESLLGRGDMLFKGPGGSRLERTQGALVEDEEITAVVEFCAAQGEQEFVEDVFITTGSAADGASAGKGEAAGAMDGDEELIQRAIQVILQDRRATTSHVQRRLRIGYNRAALIIEILEQRGIIGPQIGQAPREILVADDAPENAEDEPDDT